MRSPRSGRYVAHGTVQVAVLLGTIGPWIVRNTEVLGKPTISTVGGYTFWGAHNEVVLENPELRGSWIPTSALVSEERPLEGTEIEKEAAAYRYGFEFIKRHWTRMPELCLMKVWRLLTPFERTANRAVFWAFAISWIVIAPLALTGGVIAIKRSPDAALVLVPVLLATVGTAVLFYGSIRFRDSAAPVLIVTASVAVMEAGSRAARLWSNR